jgi:hypothetical protein
MQITRIEKMKGGWFIGDFEPSAYKTNKFEVGYKLHKAGEVWPAHYHAVATEINFLWKGTMEIQGVTLRDGDIFTIEPYEVANPIFLTDCYLIVIKTPSRPGDKYEI